MDGDTWAHVICVNWCPDIYFEDDLKTKICGKVNDERFEVMCNMCRQKKGLGACI